MKFVVSTKPLKNATALGIIKSNITKLYYRSGLIQIKMNETTLILNIEAASIKTMMQLSGSGSGEGDNAIIVDCTVFKKLIDSIDADVITLSIENASLMISAGTSRFTLPQILDVNEVQLSEPIAEYSNADEITINSADWKFVSEHQTFALANYDKTNYPVYTNIWVGPDHDVLTGDFELSLFTHSKKGNFDSSCLLPVSLINLFATIPEGSKIIKVDRNYLINISTDAYDIITEFAPKYEDDPAVGSYNSNIFFGVLAKPENNFTISIAPIIKFINQISLLSLGEFDKVITFAVKDNVLTVSNNSNEYSMDIECSENYVINFKLDYLKSVLSNFDTDTINVGNVVRDGKTIGCNFWSDNLTILLAGTRG